MWRRSCWSVLLTMLLACVVLTPLRSDRAAAEPTRAVQPRPDVVRALRDFNSDGKPDLAVWRPTTGEWFVRGLPKVQWGREGDIPVPANYFSNDPGQSDFAVWRPTTGEWWIKSRDGETRVIRWGRAGDIPMPGRYDCGGFHSAVPAVWRPSTGTWFVKAERTVCKIQWGRTGDVPNLGKYVSTDVTSACGSFGLSVWRSDAAAYLSYSGGLSERVPTGRSGDVALPPVFDRSLDPCGLDDPTVWRPQNGTWSFQTSGSRAPVQWGQLGDVPTPGAGGVVFSVWRPSIGTWYLRGSGKVQWGKAGDIPV